MSTQKRVLLLTLLVGSMLFFGMAHAVSAVAAPLPGPNAAPLLSPAGVQIVEHSPVTNAVGVDVAANISATFDESINGATVTTDTFAVHGRFSGIMAGNYVVTGSNIQVDPSRDFHTGEQVNVIATSGIRSSLGAAQTPQQWSFTAGPVTPRCVAGFVDITGTDEIGAGLSGVYRTFGRLGRLRHRRRSGHPAHRLDGRPGGLRGV